MQGRQDGIGIELEHHVLEVVNPGEVQLGVELSQQLMVAPERLELSAADANSASMQQKIHSAGRGRRFACRPSFLLEPCPLRFHMVPL